MLLHPAGYSDRMHCCIAALILIESFTGASPGSPSGDSCVGLSASKLSSTVDYQKGFVRVGGLRASLPALRKHFNQELCWCVAICSQANPLVACPSAGQPGHEADGFLHCIPVDKKDYFLQNVGLFRWTNPDPKPVPAKTGNGYDGHRCGCSPRCELAWSDTVHGSHGYNCEVWYVWDKQGRWITQEQRDSTPASDEDKERIKAAKASGKGKGKGQGKGRGKGKGKGNQKKNLNY